ncbi:Leucine-rich repeat [Macleaya cordata]|uniref:Leucine-rich repeat n=1 Tax=Macleaya cordata TaxID=56857 RepID=A0A200Q7Z2_MACCD|nr:Leucine-rich repeat [Macleaya cordata]
MADALTAFLVDQLGSVIKQEIEHEVRLVVGVRKEVEKLIITFKVIQTVLNDAEQRQMNEESVKLWLEEFKNVAYDIEDVLDEWRMEILSSQIEGLDDDDDDDGSKQIMKKKVSSCLCSPFSCFNKIALRHDIGSRIKELRERLDYIETEKENLNPLKRLLDEGAHGSRILVTTRNESVVQKMNCYKHVLRVLSPHDCCDTVVLFNHLGIARHLTLIYDKDDEVEPSSFHSSLNKVEKLRTLNVFSNYNTWKSSLRDVFHHLRCLRVLNLKGMGITHLPNEIEKLIHLRYLDLSWNDDLMELPDSISSLYNLQTLNLEWCFSLRKLPKGMSRMINLRHLNISGTDNLEYLPEGIGRLKSLQTLTKFVVDGGASGGEYQIRELKNLKFLQGYIEITGLGRLKTEDEASKAELQKKQRLSGLLLDFNPSDAMASRSGRIGEINLEELGVDDQRMERVLGVLQPHPNLKKLTVRNYLGLKFPSWMTSNTSLSHLRSLRLSKCSNCTELPALGLLPSLEFLYISKAGEVTHISREFYGIGSGRVNNLTAFLKLTRLYIYNMPKLEELDLGVVAEEEEEEKEVNKVKAAAGSRDNTIITMPCLTLLKIICCSKLKRLRVLTKLPSLQTLNLGDMENLEEFRMVVEGGDHEDSIMLPCLSTLLLGGSKNLKSIPRQLPKLDSLILIDCSSLSQLPISPNLTTLEIENSTVLPQGIAQLKELQCLKMIDIDNLTCIPEYVQNLTKLQQLTIKGCPDQLTQRCRKDEGEDWNIISHIPNININVAEEEEEEKEVNKVKAAAGSRDNTIITMPCLTLLKIICCSKLKRLRVLTKLPSLQTLNLGDMENLEEFRMVVEGGDHEDSIMLPCLSTLLLGGSKNLKSIPRQLPKLDSLILIDCSSLSQLPISPNLTTLEIENSTVLPQGIAQLKELQCLKMIDIDNLTCIPEYVQNLTKLQQLTIKGCPDQLTQRCRKDEGEDWNIISHIPNININGEKIQYNEDDE